MLYFLVLRITLVSAVIQHSGFFSFRLYFEQTDNLKSEGIWKGKADTYFLKYFFPDTEMPFLLLSFYFFEFLDRCCITV